MLERVKNYYDNIYQENPQVFGFGFPAEQVAHVSKYMKTGSALELGAGQGRNSLYLASKGFKTTAIDISPIGIESINKEAHNRGVILDAKVGDITTLEINDSYDVIISIFVLHHLTDSQALDLIKKMQIKTNPGGLNVFNVFMNQGDLMQDRELDSFYLKPGELRDLYQGWEILEYNESEVKLSKNKSDGSPMYNLRVAAIVRKPEVKDKL